MHMKRCGFSLHRLLTCTFSLQSSFKLNSAQLAESFSLGCSVVRLVLSRVPKVSPCKQHCKGRFAKTFEIEKLILAMHSLPERPQISSGNEFGLLSQEMVFEKVVYPARQKQKTKTTLESVRVPF